MHRSLGLAFILLISVALSWPMGLMAQEATPAASLGASPVAEGQQQSIVLPYMDLTADPRKDFFRYATGGWQDHTEIPADESAYNIYAQLDDLTREQLLGLLDRLADSDQLPVGSDEWKAVQLFAQAKDLKTRNAQGIEPIRGDLARIDAVSTLEEFYTLLREGFLTSNIYGLYGLYVRPDYADSSVYAAWYSGPWLGMPNRDYYWEDDEGNEEIRDAYRAMNVALLEHAGYDPTRAEQAAGRVYDLEKRLAEPHSATRGLERSHELLPPAAGGGSDRGESRLRLARVPGDPRHPGSGDGGRDGRAVPGIGRRHRRGHGPGNAQGLPHAPGALVHGWRLERGARGHYVRLL